MTPNRLSSSPCVRCGYATQQSKNSSTSWTFFGVWCDDPRMWNVFSENSLPAQACSTRYGSFQLISHVSSSWLTHSTGNFVMLLPATTQPCQLIAHNFINHEIVTWFMELPPHTRHQWKVKKINEFTQKLPHCVGISSLACAREEENKCEIVNGWKIKHSSTPRTQVTNEIS